MRTLALFAVVANLLAADERGTLLLHFLRLPVGEETYELKKEADILILRSNFAYTERGSQVPLTATLRMKSDFSPVAFTSKGKSYRPFSVDAAVLLSDDGHTAMVREGTTSRKLSVPPRYFTISGYNPFSVQMMMLRYWISHGKPKRLPQLPAALPEADIVITEAGKDQIQAAGKAVRLTRYSIGNVVWGNETVWLNEQNEIAAAATFAGGLPFEAIRSEYKDALPQLLGSSDGDRIAALTALSSTIKPVAEGSYAITVARMIDGTGAVPVNDAVIVVRDGKIMAAGPRASVGLPKGIRVIDAPTATLLPGLWEMHAHFAQVEYGPVYLAAGVTAARDCGGEFPFVTAIRDLINTRGGLGPQLILAGLVDGSGTGTFTTNWADTPEQGRAMVAKYKAAGFAQMKIYTRITPEVLKAIAEEAHRVGMTVTGHVPQGMTAQQAVEAGMDQINHFGPVQQAARTMGVAAAVQFFLEHHTVVDPTMAWGELLGRPPGVEIASFEPGFGKAPYSLTSVIGTAATSTRSGSDSAAALLVALHRAGVPIVAGTDKAVPGHSLHRELELYVKAGLPPMDVIQLATLGSAKAMRMDREMGSIEAGKQADLILVDGNPLQDFASLRRVTRVVTKGRMYDPAPLWRSAGFQP